MMIVLGYTRFANTTVFTSGRFEEMTGPAELPRMEKNMVIRVLLHQLPMVFGGDVG